ncbi:MAG: hypothetical protein AAGC48_12825, partial [Flavobacterium nitrogenifigens]
MDVSAQNKGVLIPNVPLTSLTDNVTIKNAKESLLVFNTTNSSLITPGYYYWYDNRWNRISTAGDGTTGKDGKSAYEVWTEIPGNEGKSVTDFINSLKGDKGDKGEVGIAGMSGTSGVPGIPGKDGGPGADTSVVVNDSGTWVYVPGKDGADGTWTNIDGKQGPKGDKGEVGIAGMSGTSGVP